MGRPITVEELTEVVAEQLATCAPSDRAAFLARRVPLRAVSIQRGAAVEPVFVVAEHAGHVLYYEDVEEGFNISTLDGRGFIAQPGFEQLELKHAMRRWVTEPNPTFQRTALRPLN